VDHSARFETILDTKKAKQKHSLNLLHSSVSKLCRWYATAFP
jgi:hypothetical protein